MHSHAEHGNDAIIFLYSERGLDEEIKSLNYFLMTKKFQNDDEAGVQASPTLQWYLNDTGC